MLFKYFQELPVVDALLSHVVDEEGNFSERDFMDSLEMLHLVDDSLDVAL